jgi:hypothetical protein
MFGLSREMQSRSSITAILAWCRNGPNGLLNLRCNVVVNLKLSGWQETFACPLRNSALL